jgi:pimeloyl-ACP methyl ester carboxylesterase
MVVVACVLLAGGLGLAGLLLCWSHPGQPRPFLDERGRPLPGSISEKLRVPINGVEQGMFIRGRDATRPVLLYLHGGLPEYFLARGAAAALEEDFVVCWWEQRGAGLSYHPDLPRETLTAEQLVADALAVTQYLRRRFRQDRIYLMGHSGGTFIGVQAVARAPGWYHAYIGVSQMSRQLESERWAQANMLEELRRRGDRRLARRLEAAPVTPEGGVPPAYLAVRDEAMHRLGVGTTRPMRSVFSGVILPSLQCRDYTLGEKLALWRGKAAAGVSSIWDEILRTDLSRRVPELEVPVYFFHGVHDYTCSYPEAARYFDALRAPRKGFYDFARSAHSPVFEEPEKARRILREDVLAGTNRLADRT